MTQQAVGTPSAMADLKSEYRLILNRLTTLNIESGTPAGAAEVVSALTERERFELEASYESSLRRVVGRVLKALEPKGLVRSLKSGRSRLFFVNGTVDEEVCENLRIPSRRRRVLALVERAVGVVGRAVRAVDVVAVGEQEGITEEIPAGMIKRDLSNLLKTGELVTIGTVRGDGGGTNLYLPAGLDSGSYRPDEPLTLLEQLADVFDSVWADRVQAVEGRERRPVPPSTGDVRERFRAQYPEHEALEDPQTLVNAMRELSKTDDARIRPVERPHQRRLLWAPVGVADEKLDLGNAHVSDTERVAEAVQRALNSLNVPAASVSNVKDEIDLDPRLRPAGRQKVYEILSDLARVELHNPDGTRWTRSRQAVVRLGKVDGDTYYTVPGVRGAEDYFELLRLRSEWPALNAERRLRTLSQCVLEEVQVGRARLLAEECQTTAERAGHLAEKLEYEPWAEEAHDILKSARQVAHQALMATDSSEAANDLGVPRDTVEGFTAADFLAVILPRYPLVESDDEMDASRLVPLFERQIRRVANPRFQRRFNRDENEAAEFLFERVDALTYAAFRWGTIQERHFANQAKTTLGRLRDPRFVYEALRSESFEKRLAAAACLAYLGDPQNELPRVARSDPSEPVRNAAQWAIDYIATVSEVVT